ncbi:NAD(P)/FAD-dependent oxidoreductase [Fundicoccus culcitae]|uniref:Ferredoxin--NADP reductase n=1 Tax=Fundicoccus culcitae TaxID=2969821 RepID=A0ABY5P6E1_9LACT|nr:NAD(P)/FAD-dependent oxidoreductase [Fundicoccus culcitae]UUX34312.1 NAD(P)/FAD-dependent oxidoreductase [Fundicoccus culcitae]
MTNNQKIFDITIIGGGPVGLFAAFYAGLRQASVKIIDSLELLGGQPAHLYPEKLIYDIPAYPQITGQELTDNLIEQLERFDVTYCLGEEALQLENQSHSDEEANFVIQTDKGFHQTKTIIIAAGNGAFSPRKLSLANAEKYESKNLHYYVNQINQFSNRTVAICGGGDSAVDWALTLETVASKVYLIHRRPQFRALEHNVNLLKQSSVEILTPYSPHELIGDEDKIEQVVLKQNKTKEFLTLDIDEFIVNYGFTSSLGTLSQWGLESNRNQFVVNNFFETSTPGIYAIGDIADYPGKVNIIATGFGEAPSVINSALAFIDPSNIAPHIHSSSLF